MPRPEGPYNGVRTAPPTGAIRGQTAPQQAHSLRDIPIFDLDPAAIDRALRTPVGEPLFGRHRKQLFYALIQRRVVSDKPKQSHADRQAPSQRWRMRQPPRLSNICAVSYQCLVWKSQTEKDITQIRL